MYRTGSGMLSSVMPILSEISISKNDQINIYSFVLCKYMDMFFFDWAKKNYKKIQKSQKL